MEHHTAKERYLAQYRWDVDKYQSKYPPEYWGLCRLFMLANQTSFPEARLVQLTEAFFNRGAHGQCSDPKTDRMVAALSVPVIDYILHCQPGAFVHPFQQPAKKEAIDSGRKIASRNEAESSECSTGGGNPNLPNKFSRPAPAEQKPESSRPAPAEQKPASSSQSFDSQENSQGSLERNVASSGSQLSSSKDSRDIPVVQQHSTKKEERTTAEKRVFKEPNTESDKNQVSSHEKSGPPESKRQRTTPPDDKSQDSKSSVTSDSKSSVTSDSKSRVTPDKKSSVTSDSKSSVTSDSKSSVTPGGTKSDDSYRLTNLMFRHDMARLLNGFVIIRDVGKDSTLNDDLATVEDSFKRSIFGPCTWNIFKIDKGNGLIRVRLQTGDTVLVEAEGKFEEVIKMKMASAFLNRMTTVVPVLKANASYFNEGRSRFLPQEGVPEHCKHITSCSFDSLRNLIDEFAKEKSFLELVILHHDESCSTRCYLDMGTFRMQDVIDFLEKEKSDKLKYRLAKFLHRGKNHRAICVSHIHSVLDLLSRLHLDSRYKVSLWDPQQTVVDKKEVLRSVMEIISKVTSEKERERNSRKDQSSLNKNGSVLNDHSHSTPTNSSLHMKSSSVNSHSENAANKSGSSQHQDISKIEGTQSGIPQTKDVSVVPTTSKNLHSIGTSPDNRNQIDELSRVGRKQLSKLSKSLYLIKFVKEDSTTENNPFNLLNSVCSLAYNVKMKFAMQQRKDKTWQVFGILQCDGANILVGEGVSGDCSEARLAAARSAVNTIQSYCRVVEPNFNYFAEGGVPRFISLKNPLKTSTYEIMIIDTIANPLNQEVVNLLLQMFIEDKSTEDLFFLASDYTSEERELVRKAAIHHNLGWRLFGQRSRAAAPGDVVSIQHLCVYRRQTAEELVQQLIVSGGATDKYSVVTKHLTGDVEETEVVQNPVAPVTETPVARKVAQNPVAPVTETPVARKVAQNPVAPVTETPVARNPEPKQICCDEGYPGGCFNSKCSLAHVNILDSVVNQFLGIRS